MKMKIPAAAAGGKQRCQAMRKMLLYLLTITVLTGVLTGCSGTEPETPKSTGPRSHTTEPIRPKPVEFAEDTYWVAESWLAEDGEQGWEPLDKDLWFMDLLLRTDGTARFRDVHQQVCLMDDSNQSLRWERTEEGTWRFFSRLYSQPVLEGTYDSGILQVEYMDMTFRMRRAEIPDTPGKDTLPAELAGTWIMVSGETEGYEWPAMPGELASLVIYTFYEDDGLMLLADMEDRSHFGDLMYCRYALKTQLLEYPLYEGADNELWSVRIGEESPVDDNGFPLETEFYAALLDYNTLQLQRYYTLDGYPAVSYQTYVRFTDLVSWKTPVQMELKYSNWDIAAYTDYSGNALSIPKELEGVSICLDADEICYLQYPDGTVQQGTWQLEYGGVILLQSPEDGQRPFWLAGAVSGYSVEENGESADEYQLALYYEGGILRLALSSYG